VTRKMINFKFDRDGTFAGDTVKEFRSPLQTVLFIIGCAALGLLVPFCLVLCFTNWLDPLFH
jgi:hypothetical protein